MPALASILFGAILVIFSAYALGAMLLRKLAAPPEIAFACGAAVLSVLIFCIILAGGAGRSAFLLMEGVLAACYLAAARGMPSFGGKRSALRPPAIALAIFVPYTCWYAVNALAPEILPDGLGYHLGLPSQYLRLGGFPPRLTFFDAIPQGMEMLYTMAFALGRGSAAKLVEFAFLLATPWLILRIARLLGMSEDSGLLVAAFYFCAPVSGVTGSSTYSDAGMVFFVLAAFYGLLRWRESRDGRWLAAAGLAAGFCYSIKLPGIFAVAGAVLFVAAAVPGWRLTPLLSLAFGVALVTGPWLLRNWLLLGNPVAPFGNGLFPNRYFHLLTERELSAALASLHNLNPARIPWELALGDRLTGTFGPLLLMLPAGLLAWRKPAARLCLAAAVILALPWFSNKGARFLMPAVVMAAFPMAMALPRRAAWAAIAVQAVVCWPQALNSWQPDWVFRLHDFPWRAALRLEPEADYVARHSSEYQVSKTVESATPPDARIFSMEAVATAYLARDVTVSWQSAEGDRAADALRMATLYRNDTLYAWSGAWPAAGVRGLRFRLPRSSAGEWDICEIRLRSPAGDLSRSPQWRLRAWPNVWEAPEALDGDMATRWRTWEPMRAGMYFEIDFDGPRAVTEAALLSHTPLFNVPLEIYGETDAGWRLLTGAATARPVPPPDLRLDAASALRRAGFQYVLLPVGKDGNGPIGSEVAADPLAWDMEKVAACGHQVLFRLR